MNFKESSNKDGIKKMKTTYQMIDNVENSIFTLDEFLEKFEIKDNNYKPILREELRSQPRIKGYAGPQFGGHYDEDGKSVYLNRDGQREKYGSQKMIVETRIRYEKIGMNEFYSR